MQAHGLHFLFRCPGFGCRYNMILAAYAAGAMQRLCPSGLVYSSACRGAPFQFEFPGGIVAIRARRSPQLPPSFRLPPRQGQRRPPAPPVELNAARRRHIAPYQGAAPPLAGSVRRPFTRVLPDPSKPGARQARTSAGGKGAIRARQAASATARTGSPRARGSAGHPRRPPKGTRPGNRWSCSATIERLGNHGLCSQLSKSVI